MSETKYPVGTTAVGRLSGYKYTRDADGAWHNDVLNSWYSGCVYLDNAVANGDLVDVVLPSAPAPEIKLGTVVVDRDDDVYVCVREQDDPAFVMVRAQSAPRDLAEQDDLTVFVLSLMSEEFSPLTVNGVPPTPPVPEFEEPVKIGTLVHDKFDAPWVRVVSGWLGAAEVREQSPVSWSELTADNGPLTLVEG